MSTMKNALSLCVLLPGLCAGASAQPGVHEPFTLRQVMSAPFNSDLTAAPAGDAFAWVSNAEGKRNIWVARPAADGKAYVSRQLTGYGNDDGQQIGGLTWSPDGQSILYVRGGTSDNPEKAAPNPAHFPGGAEQDVWIVSLNGAVREAGPGNSPTFSPSGDWVTWFSTGQIWYEKPAEIGVKPPQSIHVFGDSKSFTWSPDGSKLAFVSDRDSHSFIVVFAPAAGSLTFIDPGADHDSFPAWSPDGGQIAFIRVPYFKDEGFAGPQRTGRPWSIRVADAATGEGHEVWRAGPGQGSVFRALDANQQLFWTADDHLIFPWEGDGWLHLYALPAQG
ncbi:MAG TPA: hypothetical protein VMA34_20670, partial [Terracidiphilus sp.]|nr:hypothetical protein [Terracidiphilus sp.]